MLQFVEALLGLYAALPAGNSSEWLGKVGRRV